jgi:multidrug efflux pump subunit AcrB
MMFRRHVRWLVCFTLLSLGGVELVQCRPVFATENVRPSLVIEVNYPGASAEVLADTVAAPIEQQINGVERMVLMRSQCGNDGGYRLEVVFRQGTDAAAAEKLVQERLDLALPQLPAAAKSHGVSIRQNTLRPLMICSLASPKNNHGERYLSDYVTNQLRDKLIRIPGVKLVTMLPAGEYGLRVLLDPAKLVRHNLTIADVMAAIRADNAKPVENPLKALVIGSRSETSLVPVIQQYESIVVKADSHSPTIRLRDVANIEVNGGELLGSVYRDGKPCVAIVIWGGGETAAEPTCDAVKKKTADINTTLPEDVKLATTFDFIPERDEQHAAPRYLLLDVALSAAISEEKMQDVLLRCARAAQMTVNVEHTLILPENPFDRFRQQPCILVQLTRIEGKQARVEKAKESIHSLLAGDHLDANVSIRDFPGPADFPRGGYPIDFAISGPEQKNVDALAEKFGHVLRTQEALTDSWSTIDNSQGSQLFVNIDHQKAAASGVTMTDISETLQVYFGACQIGSIRRFGEDWPVFVQADIRPSDRRERFKQLKLRNRAEKLVPLSDFVEVQETKKPTFVNRLDLESMEEFTANPVPGTTAAGVQNRCQSLFEQARAKLSLPTSYRLTWLRPPFLAK